MPVSRFIRRSHREARLFALVLAGCGSDRAFGPADTTSAATVVSARIQEFAFAPAQMTVKRGATIVWTNADFTIHTVTADSGSFDSGAFGAAKSFTLVAKTTGTYAYFCRIHPYMKGMLTVTP